MHTAHPFRLLDYHDGKALDWLWEGYLAPGKITMLTGQWKIGKTTLLAALLQEMNEGGSLAGRRVRAGSAVVLSEESSELWSQRHQRFSFAGNVRWLCRPFRGRPAMQQFHCLCGALLAAHAKNTLSLVAIDSFTTFLPGNEYNANTVHDFMTALRGLTAAGMAVLILHHPRKNHFGEGGAARGGSGLARAVDIHIEMHWVDKPASGDRRRRLIAWSRLQPIPSRAVIELDEAGIGYFTLTTNEERAKPGNLPPPLRLVLRDAGRKLTREEIRDRWPSHSLRPSDVTLWRWLKNAVQRNLIRQEGAGHKADPYRYWLPECK